MKYRLLEDEFIDVYGTRLYRIQCVEAFGGIKKDEKGGFIESEKNLSQYGNAWVSGKAQVYGYAQVSGNAWVYGNARVSGNARVYGYAQVSGKAQVYGYAQVYGKAQVYGNAWVSGNAQVYGYARVYGYAQVSGKAQVYGYAQVSGKAQVSGYADIIVITNLGSRNSALTACRQEDNSIRYATGCFYGDEQEFLEAIQEKHGDNQYAIQYRAAIEFIKTVIIKKELPVS